MRYMKLNRDDRRALIGRLAAMPDLLWATFDKLSAKDAATAGPEGMPSPVEQCWHLADLEREGFLVRIRRLLSESDPALADFDGAKVAEERRYRTLSLAEGLRAFREARAETLALLRTVRGEAWQRPGRQQGVGPVALCDMPALIAEHDASHRNEIEAWLREHSA